MMAMHDLDQAMLRAYSAVRCIDYGCDPHDVHLLRDRVERGEPWSRVASELAQAHARHAEVTAHDQAQACAALLRAAACLRVAQAALEEQPRERLAIYERMVSFFEQAMACSKKPCERMAVEWNGIAHRAWAYPHQDARHWVVVWGGADGWCEAYHRGVACFHAEGLSVCLLELPGQGLARLRDHSYLANGYSTMVSATLDALDARHPGAKRYAVAGHSLGGSLALRAAADDGRIAACVTNGGSVEPKRGFIAYPRVLRRFSRMLGPDIGDARALEFLDGLELPQATRDMRAALLCLHGGHDLLVQDDEARLLVDLHANARLHAWDDGTHCIYNHADERNRVLATWLSAALADAPLSSPAAAWSPYPLPSKH